MERSDRLRWAIKNDNLAMVKRLVRRDRDMLENIDPANGWSSLHYAGYHGHYGICVYLVNEGHDRHEISLAHDRSTPLHLAASKNHEQTVHFLAQHIPRCLDWCNMYHETALMVAAIHGHDPCINLLLDFGADIDLGNAHGNRPIHIAAAYGRLKTLRTLVDRGADVQTTNSEGWRPVQYCSTYHVQDYLQSLIHEKAGQAAKRQKQQMAHSLHSASQTSLSAMSKSTMALSSPASSSTASYPNTSRPYVAFQSSTSPHRTATASASQPPSSPAPQRRRPGSIPRLEQSLPIFRADPSPITDSFTAAGGFPFAPPVRRDSVGSLSSTSSSPHTSPLPLPSLPNFTSRSPSLPRSSDVQDLTPPQKAPGRSRLLDISVSTIHKAH